MNSNQCRLCGCNLFDDLLLKLEGMPKAAQYFPEKDEFKTDKGRDLNIYQCSFCGLVQLNIKPVDYFKEVITSTSFSEETKLSKLHQMKEFVVKFGLSGKNVLEVGSGKGGMLDVLEEAGLKAIGIEASREFVEVGLSAGRRMFNGYIGDVNKIEGGPFDAFVSFNYIEHMPDPGLIIRKIYENASSEAVGFVTVPSLEYLLESKCFYEFVPDHLSYFTKETLRYAFEKNGFEVLESYVINENNDIAAVVRKRKPLNFSDNFADVEKLIKDLRKIADDYKSQKKKIAVWGAGHRTLALLAMSELSEVEYVIDSAKFKQGKFTPILHSTIVSPEHAKKNKVDLIIVMVPGLYPEEVVKTIKKMGIESDVAVLKENKIEFI